MERERGEGGGREGRMSSSSNKVTLLEAVGLPEQHHYVKRRSLICRALLKRRVGK